MSKCVNEGKFVEAEIAKQRIKQLKDIEDKKMLEDCIKKQQTERTELEESQRKELSEYNSKKDEELYELNEIYQTQINSMKEEQEKKLIECETEFENNYTKFVKPSSELIQQNKLLELYVKNQEYFFINF